VEDFAQPEGIETYSITPESIMPEPEEEAIIAPVDETPVIQQPKKIKNKPKAKRKKAKSKKRK
jgi:hypothetical protein